MKTLAFLLPLLLLAPAPNATAGDWPHIHGPNRDGQAQGEKLDTTWLNRPSQPGPKQLWTIRSGEGFSGISVAGDTAILFHRVGGNQRMQALNPATGDTRWQTDFPTDYRGGIEPDGGARSTPVIDAATKRVFVLGPAGNLHAVDLATGRKIWTRALQADTRALEGFFGAGSHPLLAGGRLLVNIGGRDAGIVALDPANGKTIWSATDERASYSGGTLHKDKAIVITRMKCLSIDPASGAVGWEFPFGMRGSTVNAAIPLVQDNTLFVSASYRVGAKAFDISGPRPRELWANDSSLSAQYTTPVIVDGHLYGTHGREDRGSGELRCVELATGKVKWTQPGAGMQFVIAAGDLLLLWKIDGNLTLIRANSERYEQLQRANITGNLSRSTPSLSNGRLFVRATPGPLVCLEVGKK